jgi:hypothetical protein
MEAPPVLVETADPVEVTVRVRGPDGAPLPAGAKARYRRPGDYRWRKVPADFQVPVEPPGPLEIEVGAEGCGPVRRSIGAGVEEILVTLPPAAGFTGRLGRESRSSLGLMVYVLTAAGEWKDQLLISPDGRFRREDLPAGRATLVATGREPSRVQAIACFDLLAGVEVDLGILPLYPSGLVSGTVLDTEGRPLGGVHVSARTTSGGTGVAYGTTASDGRFELALPEEWEGVLDLQKKGSGVRTIPVRRPHRDLTVTLRPAGTVLAVVSPAPGVWEEVSFRIERPGGGACPDLEAAEVASPDSGADRRWLLTGLPEGRFLLHVVANPALPRTAEIPVNVVSGKQVEVQVRLPD